MAETETLSALYKKAGIKTYTVSSVNNEGVEESLWTQRSI